MSGRTNEIRGAPPPADPFAVAGGTRYPGGGDPVPRLCCSAHSRFATEAAVTAPASGGRARGVPGPFCGTPYENENPRNESLDGPRPGSHHDVERVRESHG